MVREFFGEGLEPEVAAAIQEAIRVYEKAGATIKEVSLPHSRYGIPAYYIVASAECSSNLARYDGTTYGHRAQDFSPQVARRGRPGPDGPNDDGQPCRRLRCRRSSGGSCWGRSHSRPDTPTSTTTRPSRSGARSAAISMPRFGEVDVLIGPTSPTPAFKIGERTADPLAMYLSDIYTITANLAGIPGLSIPCGLTSSKSADRPPAPGRAVRRGKAAADGAGFRARDGLASEAAGERRMSSSGGGHPASLLPNALLADLARLA